MRVQDAIKQELVDAIRMLERAEYIDHNGHCSARRDAHSFYINSGASVRGTLTVEDIVTVDLDGKSVKSCTIFAVQADGADIRTIEGIANADGTLHAIQEGFREMHGLQCGFCTPGMITRAYRLLQENKNPSEEEIRFGIAGNLCRCTGYQNIVKAIQFAAAKLNGVPFQEAAE